VKTESDQPVQLIEPGTGQYDDWFNHGWFRILHNQVEPWLVQQVRFFFSSSLFSCPIQPWWNKLNQLYHKKELSLVQSPV